MAAAPTYEKIASTTLTVAGQNITFDNIPQTFTDLRFVIVGKCESGDTNSMAIRINGDQTVANYHTGVIYGNGTSAVAASRTGTDTFIYLNYSQNMPVAASTFALGIVDLYSYTSSKYKTILGQTSADYGASGEVVRVVGTWASTSAITSITATGDGNKAYSVGSVFSLYGITKA